MSRALGRKAALAWIVVHAFCLSASVAQAHSMPQELQGGWKCGDGTLLNIEAERLLFYGDDELAVYGVLQYQGGSLALRRSGFKEMWLLSEDEGTLHIKRGTQAQTQVCHRVPEIPPEVCLEPFPLGESRALPRERIESIQAELARRMAHDQEVRKRLPRSKEAAAVEAENARFLRELVREVGWIDVARFGMDAAGDAAIIAQHREDLPLMLAALPILEREMKGNPDGSQVYAVFFDRLQLELGSTQRYGSQVGMDEMGNPIVLPLENRAELEKYRKEIGLPPMAEYLKLVEQYLYPGKTVRFADDL